MFMWGEITLLKEEMAQLRKDLIASQGREMKLESKVAQLEYLVEGKEEAKQPYNPIQNVGWLTWTVDVFSKDGCDRPAPLASQLATLRDNFNLLIQYLGVEKVTTHGKTTTEYKKVKRGKG